MNPFNRTTRQSTARGATRSLRTKGARLLVAMLALLGSFAGVGALTAARASAATVTGTHLGVCFKYSNNAPYAGPVTLYRNGVLYRTGKTGSNGCGVFYNVARNSNYRAIVSQVLGAHCPKTQWSADTRTWSIGSASGVYWLPTAYVSVWRLC